MTEDIATVNDIDMLRLLFNQSLSCSVTARLIIVIDKGCMWH